MAPITTADASLGSLTKRDTEVNLPRATRVKNKTPAAVQITAAHILREARYGRQAVRPPKLQKITDVDDRRLQKELSFGVDLGVVTKKPPTKVKRMRPLPTEDDGSSIGYAEQTDYYVFPDEAALAPNLKILQAAYKWKKQKSDDDKHDE